MTKVRFFIGLDIACDDFAASIYQSPGEPVLTKEGIKNDIDGFTELVAWLKEYNINQANSVICMEATGVYGEAVAHYLSSYNFKVSVEPPLKVKRAFDPIGHKTDAVDSRQTAEYAYRYIDELKFWQPRQETVEKIRQLPITREQVTKQKVTVKNVRHAYQKRTVQVALINQLHQETLSQLEKQIDRIDKELSKLMKQDPSISQKMHNLRSIPGCGILLAANLIALTDNFEDITNYKKLAAYIGVVPYQYRSGRTISKKPRIRHFGPQFIRKLLRLAAQSIIVTDNEFRRYYLRKVDEGKAKALVLNNIANKLLKIACAIIRDDKCYIKGYHSVPPMCLKIA